MEGQSSCKINIPMGEMSHRAKTVSVSKNRSATHKCVNSPFLNSAFYFYLSYGTYHFLPCMIIILYAGFSSHTTISSQHSFCSPQHNAICTS